MSEREKVEEWELMNQYFDSHQFFYCQSLETCSLSTSNFIFPPNIPHPCLAEYHEAICWIPSQWWHSLGDVGGHHPQEISTHNM